MTGRTGPCVRPYKSHYAAFVCDLEAKSGAAADLCSHKHVLFTDAWKCAIYLYGCSLLGHVKMAELFNDEGERLL